MADADRLVAALRYQQELEGRPAMMNPNIAAQGRRPWADPAHRARVEENMADVAKFVIGETPGEVALNVALGLPNVGRKVAGMGIASLLGADEAEGAGGGAAKTARDKLVAAMQSLSPTKSTRPDVADWKSHKSLVMSPSGKAGHVVDDTYLTVRELSDGRLEIERTVAWGTKGNPFKMQGDNVNDLIAAVKQKIARSDTAILAHEEKIKRESLLGNLQKEFGENFKVSKSERSASQYITHVPSGTKIRVSDHDLPMGYVQPDVDLRKSQTVQEQLAEIVKVLR